MLLPLSLHHMSARRGDKSVPNAAAVHVCKRHDVAANNRYHQSTGKQIPNSADKDSNLGNSFSNSIKRPDF
jgi:hypothetical protein